MRDAIRPILIQAAQAGTSAALDALEQRLEAAEGGDLLAQHLATLGFRLQGDGKTDLAARAYGFAARAAPHRAPRYRLLAVRTRILGLCERAAFDPVPELLEELREAKAAAQDPTQDEFSFIDLAWGYELRGAVENAVRSYLLARIARDRLGGEALTRDGDTLEVKIKNLRRLQFDALLDARRFDEAIALHERTRRVHGAGPFAAYAITSVKALAEAGKATYAEILPARRIAPADLKFWEASPPLTSEPGDRDVPALYLSFVRDARAFPRSNVVVTDDRLVYDLAAHPRRKDILIQDGVNHDQIMMAAFGETHALVEVPEDPLQIEAGLTMFGMMSRNYGHWFGEFLPRMLCYNDPRCPDGIPLCIDDHMPSTHEEILGLLDTRGRPVIRLPARPVEFGQLGMAPVPAFFPFEMKPGLPVYDTVWPADIFGAIRRRILECARARGALSARPGRRLFISRKAFTQRVLVNEAELAERLRPLGFEVIYPETLSFLEQVDLFHAADLVVGSCNSSLNNTLFCRPGCRILGLIHEELGFNFRAYTSYIESGGGRITFLRGRSNHEPGVHPFHVSYSIDPAKLLAAVNAMSTGLAVTEDPGLRA